MENVENVKLTRLQRAKIRILSKNFLIKAIVMLMTYLMLIGLSYIVLYPLIIRISNGFKSLEDLYNSNVYLIPQNFTTSGYVTAINKLDLFGKSGAYTVFFTAFVSFFQVVSATLVGYGLARFKFPGAKLVFGIVVFTLIVPPQTIINPVYKFFQDFDPFKIITSTTGRSTGWVLTSTVIPQFLLAITSMGYKNGLYIYLMRQYFKGIPNVLEEAAYIDGAKTFKAFFRIMLPSALTMMITIFLFGFCWQWTDREYGSTISRGLPLMAQKAYAVYADVPDDLWLSVQQQTCMVVLVAPLILLFIATQRYFIESIERSGIVG